MENPYKGKNAKLFIGGTILLLVGIVVLIVYLVRKKKAETIEDEKIKQRTDTPACSQYTEAMVKKAKADLDNTCNRKLLIPVLGIGYYNECKKNGTAKLPQVGDCI